MDYQLVITPQALDDFLDISAFIAGDSPKRAYSFVEELKRSMEKSLRSFPNAGRRIGDVRVYSVGNYVILATEGHRDWQDLLEDRL
jgi:plasmid stabilization system protein ParE